MIEKKLLLDVAQQQLMVTLGSASDLCLHTQGSNCSCSDIVLLGQGSYAVAFMNVTAKWYDVMQLLMPLLLADGKEGGGGGVVCQGTWG